MSRTRTVFPEEAGIGAVTELRAAMDDRTVSGVLVPWGEVTNLVADPRGERFVRGAFGMMLRESIPLRDGHRFREAAVGRSIELKDRPHGFTGVFKVKRGAVGDEVLEDVRAGMYGGFSVEFAPLLREPGSYGVREVRIAKLLAVALACVPAYAGAKLDSTPAETDRELTAAARHAQIPRIPPRPNIPDLTPIWIKNHWGNYQRLL